MKLKIKIKLNKGGTLPEIIHKGDWVDLYASEDTFFDAPQVGREYQINGKKVRNISFDQKLIPLGVCMQLPNGFEAIIVPRSSTFRSYGVISSNSVGIIDNSYHGNDDEWKFPAIPLRETCVLAGSKLCQFRIQLSQKATWKQKLNWLLSDGIELEQVDNLGNVNRGGFGSTGK